ncbi:MATE family efflux transporter [Brachybacterium sp. GPGPB12]|uniref:MATE family efflux transporter n=2 Tax=Brachybacterium sp. GPGPB12 TaxID=3023517 RepID=UPI003134494C
MLAVQAATGLVRGLQDATPPLAVAVGGAIVNIPLNALLIFGAGLGIAGSAIGTVIAQWGMALVSLAAIVRRARREGIRLGLRPANLVAVGRDAVPMFVRTLSLRVVVIASTVVATGLGDVRLAAHQLTTTVFTVLSLALDSLAIAGQALTGRYLGASDPRTVHAVTRRLMVWGVGGGAVVAVMLAGGQLRGALAVHPRCRCAGEPARGAVGAGDHPADRRVRVRARRGADGRRGRALPGEGRLAHRGADPARRDRGGAVGTGRPAGARAAVAGLQLLLHGLRVRSASACACAPTTGCGWDDETPHHPGRA